MGSTRGLAHRWVDVGGLRLHCVEAGTGPLVVLLHGFPEFWYAWRRQLPAFADAGFRVVAPDLPGYNTSDKPPRVRDYRPRLLAQEVADLILALRTRSFAAAACPCGEQHRTQALQRWQVDRADRPARRSPIHASTSGLATAGMSKWPVCW
jgi:alpha-beta hydrolase superfamily lysophospholipase